MQDPEQQEQEFIADVSSRLRAAIEASGLSNEEIARRSGLSRANVGRIRTSEGGNVTIRTLAKLARALGQPGDQMLPSLNLASAGIRDVLLRSTADLDEGAIEDVIAIVERVRKLRGLPMPEVTDNGS